MRNFWRIATFQEVKNCWGTTPVDLSSKFEPLDDQMSFNVPHTAPSTSIGHIYLNGIVLVASRKRETRILVAKPNC